MANKALTSPKPNPKENMNNNLAVQRTKMAHWARREHIERPGPFGASQTVLDVALGLQSITATDELFNHVDHNGPMWVGEGDRHIDIPIRFVTPFKTTPLVQAGLSGIDSDQNANLRFNMEIRDLTESGFTLRMVTWDNTRIARASASWSAIGEAC